MKNSQAWIIKTRIQNQQGSYCYQARSNWNSASQQTQQDEHPPKSLKHRTKIKKNEQKSKKV